MSKHNHQCDAPGCDKPSYNDGPQYSECLDHYTRRLFSPRLEGGDR